MSFQFAQFIVPYLGEPASAAGGGEYRAALDKCLGVFHLESGIFNSSGQPTPSTFMYLARFIGGGASGTGACRR